jgi:hypothetical protein
VSAPAFSLRVHVYEDNRQDGTRTLVAYTPFLRLGAPSGSGHAGEVCYLQHGYVYGEGGDPYDVEDLPDWFGAALAALTPQARVDVGFTADRVQWYTGGDGPNDVWPSSGEAAAPVPVLPSSPTFPPGFKPDQWVLGFLCSRQHDYADTGRSRYNKQMKCVDCEALRKHVKPKQAKAPEAKHLMATT